MSLASSPRLVLALLVALAGFSAACSSAECALDTDCDYGFRCTADNRCVARGSGGDTPDAATAARDAGAASSDAGRDAGSVTPDAAAAECPALAENYAITDTTCSITATSLTLAVASGGRCAFDVTSDVVGEFEGQLSLDGSALTGDLTISGEATTCSLEGDTSSATLTCATCTVSLLAP